jgi:putative nucleotidyltransferase with HDIG domain
VTSDRWNRIIGPELAGGTLHGTAKLLADVVEADDAYTAQHSRHVVELALAVAAGLGLGPAARRRVELGALLHDIGKLAVPDAILNKQGPLDKVEWAIMQQHTAVGGRMLSAAGPELAEIAPIVRSSHERVDGRGYPDGLTGHQIPIEARIVACCDAFSAMTTDRPYRAARPYREAIAELRACAGTQFDGRVVEALVSAVAARPETLLVA